MTIKTAFGHAMRDTHFAFSPDFTPLNHGSFGVIPSPIQSAQNSFQKLAAERPDPFIVYDLPKLIDKSRTAIAPYLGVDVDEVVFVPNASTGINVVLRNLKWEEGDIVVYFSTIYAACHKTIASIAENQPLRGESIELVYPIEDEEIVRKLREKITQVRAQGKRVRLAMFDTVLTFPGLRMPWEKLVAVCKEMEVLSLIDGAHGIGHIDLRQLGNVGPDFFVSNCHKWLYTPRGCAAFHVPKRNQHLIRTSLPTSHGYQYVNSTEPNPFHKTPFVYLFQFVATIDYTPYLCVPAAIEFRQKVCGGEEAIREYSYKLAQEGGDRVAEILGTKRMKSEGGEMTRCYFANVELPLVFKDPKGGDERTGKKHFKVEEAGMIARWLNMTAVKEHDTYLQIGFHAEKLWVRLSGQIYLEMKDFEWIGPKLKKLCERVENGTTG